MQRRSVVLSLLAILPTAAFGQALQGWRLIDSAKISVDGAALSRPGVSSVGWTPAVVPGTVLTSLVKAGKYPEPLYGLDNLSIPESLCRTSYWYRTEFEVPRSHRGRRSWLRFDGVNYTAEVWVNGHAAGTVRGAFARGIFDVTPWVKVGERTVVAVKILPPNHPGVPHEQSLAGGTGPNGGATGADGVTFASTVGWDWIPGIRDRDMGLWQDVTLFSTGPVTLQNPAVRTILPLPRTDSATVSVSATLRNETSAPQVGFLEGRVEGTSLRIHVPVELAPGETRLVSAPPMDLAKPRLWWPVGYGKPELYTLRLNFVQGRSDSDSFVSSFGVRQFAYFRGNDPNLTIQVNGVPVMCRGGNWGIDEAMKRIPMARLDAQVRMHRDANCNMIRNWVGQSTEEDFYTACDKYGVMVWDDFWLANPSDGPVPVDDDLFLANAKEKILRYRNHPSIAIWCGRNEALPPPVLNAGLADLLKTLDPTRFYQPHSAAVNGVGGGGPYGQVPFSRYFQFNDAFHTEVGAPSIPTLASIEGMMPKSDWWPINDDWAYHDLTRGAQGGDRYMAALSKRYGPVSGFKDFARKGAMLTFDTYRAMFEGRNSKLFAPASGLLLWMSNPAQPSFVWQLYHYDLDPTAAMFAAKVANEPLHVQMTPEGTIQVVNTTPEPRDLRVTLTTYGLDGHVESITGSLDRYPALATTAAGTVAGSIVRLQLRDQDGRVVSENVYENGPKGRPDDLSFLDLLPKVQLKGRLIRTKKGLSLSLANDGKTPALLAHLSLRHADGTRVLPTFYSDNFVNVFPGESRTIEIEAVGAGSNPKVFVDGWNVDGVTGPGAVYNEDARPEPPLPPTPPRAVLPGTILSIDCGGENIPGSAWNPDEEFASGGSNEIQPGIVTGSDLPSSVLATERWGECSYVIPVPDGHYRVRLVFAETSQPRVGGRIFNVDLNRRSVLSNFDIFAEAGGANRALAKEFPDVSPDRNGNIVVRFRKGSANEPEIRAIQILPST